MATKKYRVTNLASPFVEDGVFKFRLRFSDPDEPSRMVAPKYCPTMSVPYPAGVIEIDDEIAQRMIENMIAPTNTARGGSKRPGGHLFEEVPAAIASSTNFGSEISGRYTSRARK